MERPTVEFLVHGEDIAETRVQLAKDSGLTLDRVTTVENPNYVFVRLRIADTAEPGDRKSVV